MEKSPFFGPRIFPKSVVHPAVRKFLAVAQVVTS